MSREITWVHSVKQEREPPWTEGRDEAEAEARPRVSSRGGLKGSDCKGPELPAPMTPRSLLLI